MCALIRKIIWIVADGTYEEYKIARTTGPDGPHWSCYWLWVSSYRRSTRSSLDKASWPWINTKIQKFAHSRCRPWQTILIFLRGRESSLVNEGYWLHPPRLKWSPGRAKPFHLIISDPRRSGPVHNGFRSSDSHASWSRRQWYHLVKQHTCVQNTYMFLLIAAGRGSRKVMCSMYF